MEPMGIEPITAALPEPLAALVHATPCCVIPARAHREIRGPGSNRDLESQSLASCQLDDLGRAHSLLLLKRGEKGAALTKWDSNPRSSACEADALAAEPLVMMSGIPVPIFPWVSFDPCKGILSRHGRSRTCDLWLRKPALYPAELRPDGCVQKSSNGESLPQDLEVLNGRLSDACSGGERLTSL